MYKIELVMHVVIGEALLLIQFIVHSLAGNGMAERTRPEISTAQNVCGEVNWKKKDGGGKGYRHKGGRDVQCVRI